MTVLSHIEVQKEREKQETASNDVSCKPRFTLVSIYRVKMGKEFSIFIPIIIFNTMKMIVRHIYAKKTSLSFSGLYVCIYLNPNKMYYVWHAKPIIYHDGIF